MTKRNRRIATRAIVVNCVTKSKTPTQVHRFTLLLWHFHAATQVKAIAGTVITAALLADDPVGGQASVSELELQEELATRRQKQKRKRAKASTLATTVPATLWALLRSGAVQWFAHAQTRAYAYAHANVMVACTSCPNMTLQIPHL